MPTAKLVPSSVEQSILDEIEALRNQLGSVHEQTVTVVLARVKRLEADVAAMDGLLVRLVGTLLDHCEDWRVWLGEHVEAEAAGAGS